MSGMFSYCSRLKEIDVSGFDTSNVEIMEFMFWSCQSLTRLEFADWDVRKVTTFDHFLAKCTSLADYDVSKWEVTDKCTRLYAMFHDTRVESLDIRGWDTSNVITFGQMFEKMYNLKEIKGLEEFDTSSSKDFVEMFLNATAIEKLDLSSFDTRNATYGIKCSANGSVTHVMLSMFGNNRSLKEIKVGENFTLKGDGQYPEYFGSLPSTQSGYWYSVSDGAAYLPSEIPDGAGTYVSSLDLLP
jgi:surface protein